MSRINVELIKRINALLVGSRSRLLDQGLLESALGRPGNYQHYEDRNAPASRLAAELSFGIIKNHSFMDGNKRTAFLAANEYLRELGHKGFVDAELESAAKSSELQKALDKLGQIHEEVAGGTKDIGDLAKAYANAIGK